MNFGRLASRLVASLAKGLTLGIGVAGLSAREPALALERDQVAPWGDLPSGTSAHGAASPEFRGVMSLGPEVSVALAASPDAPVRWIPIGGRFEEYTVAALAADREALILVSPAGERRLPLRASHVSRAPGLTGKAAGPAGGGLAPEAVARVRENLAQLAVAAAYYFETSPGNDATAADLVGPGRLIEVLRPIVGEDYTGLRLTRVPGALAIILADGATITLEPEAAALAASRYHLVRRGDDVTELARRSGQPLSAVLELNEIAAPDEPPRAGRLLRLR